MSGLFIGQTVVLLNEVRYRPQHERHRVANAVNAIETAASFTDNTDVMVSK